jgi:hypothetical protein
MLEISDYCLCCNQTIFSHDTGISVPTDISIYSPVVTTRAVCRNIKKLHILAIQSLCVFHKFLTINTDYKQHWLFLKKTLCSL